MSELPADVKALKAAFLAEQARDEAKRDAARAGTLTKKQRHESRSGGPMTSTEMESYAKRWGFRVETGHGKHGMHLIAPNGKACSLPTHGGGRSLATGTDHTIRSFIHKNGTSPN